MGRAASMAGAGVAMVSVTYCKLGETKIPSENCENSERRSVLDLVT